MPAQFSPLLFYWMVSWWPKLLHGTFLPLAEGNWQVCNYLFNEADLFGPVENIMRCFNILAITKNHQNKHRMKDISIIYPLIERANDTPLSRPFSLACFLHIIAIFYPIIHYKEQSLLNVTARLWHETFPALQIKAQNRVFRHFVISELNRIMPQCLRITSKKQKKNDFVSLLFV